MFLNDRLTYGTSNSAITVFLDEPSGEASLLLKTINFCTEKKETVLYLYENLYICAQKVFITINTL